MDVLAGFVVLWGFFSLRLHTALMVSSVAVVGLLALSEYFCMFPSPHVLLSHLQHLFLLNLPEKG